MDAVRWEKFEDPSHSPKRKKHSSIACAQCRKLKIRCQGGSPAPTDPRGSAQACNYCVQHSKSCNWPIEDGRKLKRQRSRSDSQSSNGSGHTGAGRLAGLAIQETSAPKSNKSKQLPVLEEHRTKKSFQESPPSHRQRQSVSHEASNGIPNAETRRSSASDTPYTTVHYYRHHGPTALAPGHKQVSLKARYDSSEYAQTGQKVPPDRPQGFNQRVFGSSEPQLFDSATSLPNQCILPGLLDAFFEYYGDLYCFLNRSVLEQQIDAGKPPVFLIAAMSALSSRFCAPDLFRAFFPPLTGDVKREMWEYSSPFLEKAKSMVISAINLPTTEGIAGLLFLAFADFGDNNEAGLYMYTGMAVRMVQEIGLQRRRSERRPSYQINPQDIEASKKGMETVDPDDFQESADVILFWCVFAHDVALCNGTGRVPDIKAHEISVRYPTHLDVARVRAGPGHQTKPLQSEVYPEMAQIMLLVAESVDFLNTGASQIKPSSQSQAIDRFNKVDSLRTTMIRAYRSLPKEVSFGAIYYRKAVDNDQASPYLLLHLQYHMQIAFLSQESLVEMAEPTNVAQQKPPEPLKATSNELYKSSIKAITDMLTIAKLIDDRPCTTVVYLNQAFFHAACAYCRDMVEVSNEEQASDGPAPTAFPLGSHSSPSMVYPLDATRSNKSKASERAKSATFNFLSLVARANYQFLRQAIKAQTEVYAGSGWVDAVLDQRETGLRDVDLSVVSDKISTFIRLQNLKASGNFQNASQQYIPPLVPPVDQHAQMAAIPEISNIDWSNFSTDLFADAELDFDPQAFFTDYMFSEQANMGFA